MARQPYQEKRLILLFTILLWIFAAWLLMACVKGTPVAGGGATRTPHGAIQYCNDNTASPLCQ